MNNRKNILSRLVCASFVSRERERRGCFLAVIGLVCLSQWVGAQSLPTDAKQTCVVTPSQFAGWFATNTVTLNGVVNPANSVAFPNIANCSFYQWSEQMFLWLNSPAPAEYGGGDRIFDSPAFFDVSPLNSNDQRTLIPHVVGKLRPFPLPVRGAQVGPDGLQIIFDKAGRMLEVQPPKIAASGKQLILNTAGKEVEIEHATIRKGKVTFLDKAGKTIPSAKPILEKRLLMNRGIEEGPAGRMAPSVKEQPILIVQRFIIDGLPIFIDPFGNLDPVEQGQAATNAVLETQNGSLVYYTIAVNDVYAYFLTGAKSGGITPFPSFFPTTQADLTSIVNFARTKGVTFPDPNALAIEVKASWVDASTLPGGAAGYVTMKAKVPVYNTTSSTTWIPTTNTNDVNLAMVGMHVVGSVAGHPEMIWATFEHVGNTPLATYSYNSTSGLKTVNQNTAGTWLFSAGGAGAPFNTIHMNLVPPSPNIQALSANPPTAPPPFTISASNTIRWKPFGASSDVSPNPVDGSPAASNTEIISINNNIRGMLIGGDLRGNYIMSGATWTIGGAAPTSTNQVGTSLLANSTMETYVQGSSTVAAGSTNCFSCHQGFGASNPLAPQPPPPPSNFPNGLSHIFGVIQALP
jgi:hypothetical protein